MKYNHVKPTFILFVDFVYIGLQAHTGHNVHIELRGQLMGSPLPPGTHTKSRPGSGCSVC